MPTMLITKHARKSLEIHTPFPLWSRVWVASSPGPSQLFNVARFSTCNIESWEGPGDEAKVWVQDHFLLGWIADHSSFNLPYYGTFGLKKYSIDYNIDIKGNGLG